MLMEKPSIELNTALLGEVSVDSKTIYDCDDNEATEAIVDKYCDLSTKVCYDCGAPATGYTKGWITFVCDKHRR